MLGLWYIINTYFIVLIDKTAYFQYAQYSDEFELKCLCEVKSQFLRSWVVSLMKAEKSPRSIHRKVSSYRTFVKFARRKGWMDTNPIESVVLPKLEKRLPNVVPEHAMNSLFSGDIFPDDWLGRRDQASISLLYETGLRRSELISLKMLPVKIEKGNAKNVSFHYLLIN